MFVPRGSVAERRILFMPIVLLLALLLAACSNAGSADRSVAASDPTSGERARTEGAAPVAIAEEETNGAASLDGEMTGYSVVFINIM